jgi:hypothetical protein
MVASVSSPTIHQRSPGIDGSFLRFLPTWPHAYVPEAAAFVKVYCRWKMRNVGWCCASTLM